MPSERSMPSEITGEKAERTKARSISLQTWIRPFWMTVRVTGSRFDMLHAYHISRVIPSEARDDRLALGARHSSGASWGAPATRRATGVGRLQRKRMTALQLRVAFQ